MSALTSGFKILRSDYDGNLFYFALAATIRQLSEVLLIAVGYGSVEITYHVSWQIF
jgi:hypothetical protein